MVLGYQLVFIITSEYAPVWVGHDYRLYMEAADRWLSGGTFYHPYQLTGPYPVMDSEVLYPPVALLVFVPFTVLPAILWWAVPISVTLWVIAAHHPGPWRIAAMLGLLALPPEFGTSYSLSSIVNGNPVIWVTMTVALATRWPFAGPFALVKFTLAPFALVGIRKRTWWLGLLVLLLASLPFGAMWLDYAVVLLNAQGADPLYSLRQFSLVAIPLVAYAGTMSTRV